jgi:hypothetical protein
MKYTDTHEEGLGAYDARMHAYTKALISGTEEDINLQRRKFMPLFFQDTVVRCVSCIYVCVYVCPRHCCQVRVYVCVYACMCVCVLCMYACMHVYTCMYIHTYKHIGIHVYMPVCTHTHKHTHTSGKKMALFSATRT